MKGNKLIVTNKNNEEEIYKKSRNKWIIELDGNKISNWGDYYDIMQKELDILNYDKQFGKGYHTYDDFARDIVLFEEVNNKNKKGIVIILKNIEKISRISLEEKSIIYDQLVDTLLLQWYRDLKYVYIQEKPTINIRIYILIDNKNINKNLSSELIILTNKDLEKVKKKNKETVFESVFFEKNLEDVNYLKLKKGELIDVGIAKIEKLLLKEKPKNIIIENFEDIVNRSNVHNHYVYFIEDVLLKSYNKNCELKIYLKLNDEW